MYFQNVVDQLTAWKHELEIELEKIVNKPRFSYHDVEPYLKDIALAQLALDEWYRLFYSTTPLPDVNDLSTPSEP